MEEKVTNFPPLCQKGGVFPSFPMLKKIDSDSNPPPLLLTSPEQFLMNTPYIQPTSKNNKNNISNTNVANLSGTNMSTNMQMTSISGAAIGVPRQKRTRPAHGLAVRSSSHNSLKENNTHDPSVLVKNNMNSLITSVNIFKNALPITNETTISSFLNNNNSSSNIHNNTDINVSSRRMIVKHS